MLNICIIIVQREALVAGSIAFKCFLIFLSQNKFKFTVKNFNEYLFFFTRTITATTKNYNQERLEPHNIWKSDRYLLVTRSLFFLTISRNQKNIHHINKHFPLQNAEYFALDKY